MKTNGGEMQLRLVLVLACQFRIPILFDKG
jgi:hypothetical protein